MVERYNAELRIEVNGEWTTWELQRLLGWTDTPYNLFLAVDVWEQRFVPLLRELDSRLPSFLDERLWLRWGLPSPGRILPTVLDIRRNIHYYVSPGARVKVSSIHIESPGFISLVGLGEVIRELREFIKDIWYRNRSEAKVAKAEAEARKARAELLRKYYERWLDYFSEKGITSDDCVRLIIEMSRLESRIQPLIIDRKVTISEEHNR